MYILKNNVEISKNDLKMIIRKLQRRSRNGRIYKFGMHERYSCEIG